MLMSVSRSADGSPHSLSLASLSLLSLAVADILRVLLLDEFHVTAGIVLPCDLIICDCTMIVLGTLVSRCCPVRALVATGTYILLRALVSFTLVGPTGSARSTRSTRSLCAATSLCVLARRRYIVALIHLYGIRRLYQLLVHLLSRATRATHRQREFLPLWRDPATADDGK